MTTDSNHPTSGPPATPPPPPPPQHGAAGPPPGPPARPRAWRGPLLVGIVAAGVALAAGGLAMTMTGGDKGDVADGGGDLTVAPPTLGQADLPSALLSATDVGGDFAEQPSSTVRLSNALQMSSECRDAVDRIDPSSPDDAGQRTSFVGGGSGEAFTFDGTQVWHEVSLVEEGSPSFGAIRDVLEGCGTATLGDELGGSGIRFHAEVIDGPGENTMAVTWEYILSDGSIGVSTESYQIISARGGVLSSVLVGSQSLESEPVDPDFVRDLAEQADRKVQDVLDG
jgi:hypothetical protein